ncbi:MAG: hypothetical protein ACXABU_17120 [Candidatus Hodarchaeales archaeon]|jgi:hypothetical protein
MSDSRLDKILIGSGMILISILIFFVALMEVSNFTTFTGDQRPVGPVDLKNLGSIILYSFSGLGLLVGGSIMVSTNKE